MAVLMVILSTISSVIEGTSIFKVSSYLGIRLKVLTVLTVSLPEIDLVDSIGN